VTSQVSGTTGKVTFVSDYATLLFDGGFQNQYFDGNLYYANQSTNGQPRILGRFRVNKCGFFVC
jgi:N-acetylneuraminic acid mutarotase